MTGYSTDSTVNFHALPIEGVYTATDAQPCGLTAQQAAERFAKYGPNQIKRKGNDTILTLLWRQINNPLIWVLVGSCALAIALGKFTDGLVVLSVVVINTIIGFFQEYKAGKAIEAISGMVPDNATVLRDGTYITLPVSQLVPGDIVQLAAGDRVPADSRIIGQKNLTVEEAALTGESLPVQKLTEPVAVSAVLGDRKCMVYSGTLVVSGSAKAVVVATGMATELGKISAMIGEAVPLETPLTHKLAQVGKYLTIGIVAVTILILIAGTIRATQQGIEFTDSFRDSLIFAIALAVGAIPEGLPAVVTIALAIGVQRMAKRKALVRKLPAVETLGSTTVICSDKTGTLTRNEMTVCEIWNPDEYVTITGAGYDTTGTFAINSSPVTTVPAWLHQLLTDAVLCNDASIVTGQEGTTCSGDPTEVALVVAGAKAGITDRELRERLPRTDQIPFDSEAKYMASLHSGSENILIIKGAPEVILAKCNQWIGGQQVDAELVHSQVDKMGDRGMRVLAIARKVCSATVTIDHEVHEGFLFEGLIGMIDPPRQEAMDAIGLCHKAGIVVKMITGDHKATARAIGMQLGLSTDGLVVTGNELAEMDDNALSQAALQGNIFARVAPEHKLKLVKALQTHGHIVAMTGDGVNDAPSLKQSNIGVAMGITGTSVSKEAADIVLADDNFSSISAAVEEGRRVYDNLLKSLAFLLPTNLGLAFIMVYGILFFPFNPVTKELLLPMLPVQLLWINLVAAIALALPLAFEVKERAVMQRPPRKPDASLFNRFITFRVVFVSLLMTAGTILLFKWQYRAGLESGITESIALAEARTIALTFVIMFQSFYMLNCRSLRDSIFHIGVFSNSLVFVGIAAILALQAILVYNPFMQRIFGTTALDGDGILQSLAAGLVVFVIIGLEKWVTRLSKRS